MVKENTGMWHGCERAVRYIIDDIVGKKVNLGIILGLKGERGDQGTSGVPGYPGKPGEQGTIQNA